MMFPTSVAIGMDMHPSGVHTPDNIILSVILALFVIMGLNASHLRHIVSTFFADLLSHRSRANIFDVHNTASDTRIILLMLVQTSIFEGILLAGWSSTVATSDMAYASRAGILSAIAAIFNLFSYIASSTVGYVFTTPQNASLWRHTLITSQGILGISLLIPTTVSVLWTDNPAWIYISGISLYILMRMCYIYKGISFFYNNILSSFYFILYLCALEIIPVIVAIGRDIDIYPVLIGIYTRNSLPKLNPINHSKREDKKNTGFPASAFVGQIALFRHRESPWCRSGIPPFYQSGGVVGKRIPPAKDQHLRFHGSYFHCPYCY